MEVSVEKITDEPAVNVLGAVAAANIPDPPKKKSCTLRFPNKSAPAVTSAAEADLISDLVHKIENLKESDAKARLFELEEAHDLLRDRRRSLGHPEGKVVRPLRLARRMG